MNSCSSFCTGHSGGKWSNTMDNLIPFSPSQKTDAKANVSRFNNELLSRREAAAYLGIAENTLAIWKCSGRYGLPFVKMGRLVSTCLRV